MLKRNTKLNYIVFSKAFYYMKWQNYEIKQKKTRLKPKTLSLLKDIFF